MSGKITLPERDIMERSTASKTSRFSEYFIKNYINELSDSKEVKDVKIESGDFQI